MIIDGHSHVTFPIGAHIAAMDKAHIDKTILFSTTLHPETATKAREVKEAFLYLNDLLAGKKGSILEARKKAIQELMGAIRQFPNRFVGFGAVPPNLDLNATMQFVDEFIRKNSLAGMGEFTLGLGQAHLLENVFKASREFRNLPIWIHAFFPLMLDDINKIAKFAKQYPDTDVILGHLGGCNWLETMGLVKEIPNLYLDTSASYSTFVLGIVINEIPDKCIFGVDSPYGDIFLSKETILKVSRTPEVANAVLGENISRILAL